MALVCGMQQTRLDRSWLQALPRGCETTTTTAKAYWGPICQQKSKSEPALQTLSGIQNRGTSHMKQYIHVCMLALCKGIKQDCTSAYLFVGFRQDLLSSLENPSFLTQYQEGDCVGRELVKQSCLPANRLIKWQQEIKYRETNGSRKLTLEGEAEIKLEILPQDGSSFQRSKKPDNKLFGEQKHKALPWELGCNILHSILCV